MRECIPATKDTIMNYKFEFHVIRILSTEEKCIPMDWESAASRLLFLSQHIFKNLFYDANFSPCFSLFCRKHQFVTELRNGMQDFRLTEKSFAYFTKSLFFLRKSSLLYLHRILVFLFHRLPTLKGTSRLPLCL